MYHRSFLVKCDLLCLLVNSLAYLTLLRLARWGFCPPFMVLTSAKNDSKMLVKHLGLSSWSQHLYLCHLKCTPYINRTRLLFFVSEGTEKLTWPLCSWKKPLSNREAICLLAGALRKQHIFQQRMTRMAVWHNVRKKWHQMVFIDHRGTKVHQMSQPSVTAVCPFLKQLPAPL